MIIWNKISDGYPKIGTEVLIRGPQMTVPLKAKFNPKKDEFAPCWDTTEKKRAGVGEYADSVTEWSEIEGRPQ